MNRVFCVALCVGVLVAGCSSGLAVSEPNGSPPVSSAVATTSSVPVTESTTTSTPGPAGTGEALDDASSGPLPQSVESQADLMRLLKLTPFFSDRTVNIRLHDYEFERESPGIEPYDGPSDEAAVREYFSPTGYFRTLTFLNYRSPLAIAAWREEFGFSLVDVEQIVDSSETGRPLFILSTTRTPVEIATAVQSDETWGPRLTQADEGPATVYSWGDDYQSDLRSTTAGRELGEAGQLAVLDDVVVRTHGRPELDAVLAAAEGGDSLAVHEPTAQTVAALLRQGAYLVHGSSDVRERDDPFFLMDSAGAIRGTVTNGSVRVTNSPGTATVGTGTSSGDMERSPVQFLEGFDFVAVGHAAVEGRVDGLVAFHFDSPEQAAENAARFALLVDRGRDLFGPRGHLENLGSPLIGVDGSVVVARFEQPRRDGRGEPQLLELFRRESTLFWRAG